MEKTRIKNDKGTAGLAILLSIIVLMFMIGLLIYIFVIMGTELQASSYGAGTNTTTNETITKMSEVDSNLKAVNFRDAVCTVTQCVNATAGTVIATANYTATNCAIKGIGGAGNIYINNSWQCSYTFTYSADTTATNVMNDTTHSIVGGVDFFDIFIVIGSMVVLILLTVVIITAIRSSGLVAGGTMAGGNTYQGTA